MLRGVQFASVAALLCVALATPIAHASDQTDLEKVRSAYAARNYADAESRVSGLLNPKTGSKDALVVSTARMYEGAIYLARGMKREAHAAFERLLLEDAPFEPDPLAFPPDVVNAFIDTRAGLRERLAQLAQDQARLEASKRAQSEAERKREADRVKLLEKYAREETVTTWSSRLVATVPFGIGQFQNGQTGLGIFFLSLETALIAGSLIAVPVYNNARGREREEFLQGDPNRLVDQYHARANAARIVNWSFAGAFLAAAGIGIAQAHVAFTPAKREIVPRKIEVGGVDLSRIEIGPRFGERGPSGVDLSVRF